MVDHSRRRVPTLCCPVSWVLHALPSPASGVGHDEDTFSYMRRTNGASRKYIRLRGVARTFQVSLYEVECQADETSNIFDKHPSGPTSLNNGKSRRPEVTVIVRASSLS